MYCMHVKFIECLTNIFFFLNGNKDRQKGKQRSINKISEQYFSNKMVVNEADIGRDWIKR